MCGRAIRTSTGRPGWLPVGRHGNDWAFLGQACLGVIRAECLPRWHYHLCRYRDPRRLSCSLARRQDPMRQQQGLWSGLCRIIFHGALRSNVPGNLADLAHSEWSRMFSSHLSSSLPGRATGCLRHNSSRDHHNCLWVMSKPWFPWLAGHPSICLDLMACFNFA